MRFVHGVPIYSEKDSVLLRSFFDGDDHGAFPTARFTGVMLRGSLYVRMRQLNESPDQFTFSKSTLAT